MSIETICATVLWDNITGAYSSWMGAGSIFAGSKSWTRVWSPCSIFFIVHPWLLSNCSLSEWVTFNAYATPLVSGLSKAVLSVYSPNVFCRTSRKKMYNQQKYKAWAATVIMLKLQCYLLVNTQLGRAIDLQYSLFLRHIHPSYTFIMRNFSWIFRKLNYHKNWLNIGIATQAKLNCNSPSITGMKNSFSGCLKKIITFSKIETG